MFSQGLPMRCCTINSTSPALALLNWNNQLHSGWLPKFSRYQIPTATNCPCDFSTLSGKFGVLGGGSQGKLVSWRCCSWQQPGKGELLQQSSSCRAWSRSIAPQTFINIQKTNIDSVAFVNFSFYLPQTSQLYSRACVNTWGKLSLASTSPWMCSGVTQRWKACTATQEKSWSNRVHGAELATESEHRNLDSPPCHWTFQRPYLWMKPSVMRNSPDLYTLNTLLVASAGQNIWWPLRNLENTVPATREEKVMK